VGGLHQQHSLAVSDAMILAAVGDIYDGINISAEELPADPTAFADSLQQSLQEWQQTGRKGIWLKVPITHAQLVPVATQHGFYFHHAEPEYVMLARWLPDTENKLPSNASHQVGVGAFVFDRQQQRVLMVQERNGPLRGKGVWKMPTGLSMAREDIADAAEREVLEETGVRAKSRAVIAIRQAHTALFGKSDLFAVVALEPEADGQDTITVQEDELVAAEWQTLAQFEDNPFPKDIPLLGQIVERCSAYARGDYPGMKIHKFPVPSRHRQDILMYASNSNQPFSEL
jgi:ADP-ribose pyrophosphatase YjhB (NUDIX family)